MLSPADVVTYHDACRQLLADLRCLSNNSQFGSYGYHVKAQDKDDEARDVVDLVLFGDIGWTDRGHLRSWAGRCPRSDESTGKRRSSRIRHGARWLKTTLVQSAWAAIRVKDSYLRAQFYRIKSRVGPMKAIVAVAASMLTAAFHIAEGEPPPRASRRAGHQGRV
jgi:hypothetical protein